MSGISAAVILAPGILDVIEAQSSLRVAASAGVGQGHTTVEAG
jgi:hypothetical protein